MSARPPKTSYWQKKTFSVSEKALMDFIVRTLGYEDALRALDFSIPQGLSTKHIQNKIKQLKKKGVPEGRATADILQTEAQNIIKNFKKTAPQRKAPKKHKEKVSHATPRKLAIAAVPKSFKEEQRKLLNSQMETPQDKKTIKVSISPHKFETEEIDDIERAWEIITK